MLKFVLISMKVLSNIVTVFHESIYFSIYKSSLNLSWMNVWMKIKVSVDDRWMFGFMGWTYSMPFLVSLTFGALISATDPVTVLAIFNVFFFTLGWMDGWMNFLDETNNLCLSLNALLFHVYSYHNIYCT